MGFFKKIKKFAGFASGYTPIGGFGLLESASSRGDTTSPAGSLAGAVGYETPAAKGEAKRESVKAVVAAVAAVRQAEFEASRREGLERLALKRKKGFGASMIVNPALGSGSRLGS